MNILILFVLFFLLLHHAKLKNYTVCVCVFVCEYYAYHTIALVMEIIPTCFELRVRYDWQAMALKWSSRCSTFSFGHFFDFSRNNCVGVTHIVRSHLDN